MMIGFLSKPEHRPRLAAVFGILLVIGIIVWVAA
jgi:hypothetical protein